MTGKVETNPFLGRRIRLLREELDLTQAELAEKLGFGHRQTLQQIEADERKLTVDELLKLMETSGRSFEYFTDPFRWDGDGQFSYRTTSATDTQLDSFEQAASDWIMLWRWLHSVNGLHTAPVPDFGIGVRSSYEDVWGLAEKLVRWFKLGDVPALSLGPILETELYMPVLNVDFPIGVSGASCHFGDGNVILVNRNDAPGRRNFDLAHEFFHVLTWTNMPPERIDRSNPPQQSSKRREELAENFASALLMPEEAMRRLWDADAGSTIDNIQHGANHFHVSQKAFTWRLVAIELLQKKDAWDILEEIERAGPLNTDTNVAPPLFSRFFLQQLAVAIEAGRVSVRRAAKLLALDIDELETAYRNHSLIAPFDM